jgi:hypothetical protein
MSYCVRWLTLRSITSTIGHQNDGRVSDIQCGRRGTGTGSRIGTGIAIVAISGALTAKKGCAHLLHSPEGRTYWLSSQCRQRTVKRGATASKLAYVGCPNAFTATAITVTVSGRQT